MRIAVIHEAPRVTSHSREILERIKGLGHEAVYVRIGSLNVGINSQGTVITTGKGEVHFDGAFPRGIGSYVSTEMFTKRMSTLRALEFQGVRLINSAESIEKSKDKLYSLMLLARRGVAVPQTMVTENPTEVMKFVERVGEAVIKPIMGSLGLGSIKVDDPDIGYRVAKTVLSTGSPVYVQEYVKKPDRDIRLIFIGDEVLGAVYRINHNSWKTNVAQGAVTQVLSVNVELENLAMKVREIMGLDYAGIDIVESERGYLVLEVNASPLWKGFRAATGIDVAKHLVDYMIRELKR